MPPNSQVLFPFMLLLILTFFGHLVRAPSLRGWLASSSEVYPSDSSPECSEAEFVPIELPVYSPSL